MHGMAALLFAGELHIDSAVFIARASEPVVSKHPWATSCLVVPKNRENTIWQCF
jgi:hypothetical protein